MALMPLPLVAVATILVFSTRAYGQTSNTELCARSSNNAPFNKNWCNRLTKKEGCRLGVVNLLFAASEGDMSSLRRYQNEGMDMKMSDYDKRTALHLAAAEGHLEATKFLLETARVPPTPRDRWGYTPLDEARRFRHSNVEAYLKRFRSTNRSGGLGSLGSGGNRNSQNYDASESEEDDNSSFE